MLTSKKQSRHLYKRGILLVTVIGGFLLLSLAATLALADSPVITGTVTAGALSQGASTPGSFSGPVGGTGTISNLVLSVSDLRGSGIGWHITVASTTLSYSSGVSAGTPTPGPFPTNASQMTTTTANCTTAGTCSDATLVNSTPVTIPAAATPAVTLFSAAANTGLGVYTITPTIVVTIPGYAKVGITYASTYTLTAVSGP